MGRARILVAIGALAACEIDASIGRDELESQGGGGGDAIAEGGASDSDGSGDAGGSGGGEDEGGSGGGGGTSAGPADGDADGESGVDTTDVAPLCQHHDTDPECVVCRKGHCCDQLVHCHDQPGCFCFWECLVTTDDTPEACRTHCAYDGLAFDELIACQEDQCPGICSEHPEDLPPMD